MSIFADSTSDVRIARGIKSHQLPAVPSARASASCIKYSIKICVNHVDFCDAAAQQHADGAGTYFCDSGSGGMSVLA